MTVIRISGHRISHKSIAYPHVQHRNCESGLGQSMLHTSWSSKCCKTYGDGMDRWNKPEFTCNWTPN